LDQTNEDRIPAVQGEGYTKEQSTQLIANNLMFKVSFHVRRSIGMAGMPLQACLDMAMRL